MLNYLVSNPTSIKQLLMKNDTHTLLLKVFTVALDLVQHFTTVQLESSFTSTESSSSDLKIATVQFTRLFTSTVFAELATITDQQGSMKQAQITESERQKLKSIEAIAI